MEAPEEPELSMLLELLEAGAEALLPLLESVSEADLPDIELHAASDAAHANAMNHLDIDFSWRFIEMPRKNHSRENVTCATHATRSRRVSLLKVQRCGPRQSERLIWRNRHMLDIAYPTRLR